MRERASELRGRILTRCFTQTPLDQNLLYCTWELARQSLR